MNDANEHQTRLVLSVPEAAHLLGISRSLAYQLVERNDLPALRLGRRLVVPRKALERLIEGDGGPNPAA